MERGHVDSKATLVERDTDARADQRLRPQSPEDPEDAAGNQGCKEAEHDQRLSGSGCQSRTIGGVHPARLAWRAIGKERTCEAGTNQQPSKRGDEDNEEMGRERKDSVAQEQTGGHADATETSSLLLRRMRTIGRLRQNLTLDRRDRIVNGKPRESGFGNVDIRHESMKGCSQEGKSCHSEELRRARGRVAQRRDGIF